jgi:hypothetical protein
MEQRYETTDANQAMAMKKILRGLQSPIQLSKFASEPTILAIFSSSDRIGISGGGLFTEPYSD